jgi:histidinol-phosphate/aromatic aminotransferase/cobyric acid decarboxylase-like protein
MTSAVVRQEVAGACFHGGAFFDAVGDDFKSLDRATSVINADVLDAWFPPAPAVLETLEGHLPWLLRTSPPTQAGGLVRTIAKVRRVPDECVLVGAGSSDLIYRAFREWLSPASRVLLLDPTYGEYAHVCENVVGCEADRFRLRREQGYRVDLRELSDRLDADYDLLVIVNPNNPTGQSIPSDDLARFLDEVPEQTRVWIDEAYLEYTSQPSLERFAAVKSNVIVCKSMSKVYALSGARAAYLVGRPELISELRRWTPPWSVSLPAQAAAIGAMESPDYYARRYAETNELRVELARGIAAIDPHIDVVVGLGNYVLFHLPTDGHTAGDVVQRCRTRNLYLRDAGVTSPSMGRYSLRAAVKDEATQRRMLEILASVLNPAV